MNCSPYRTALLFVSLAVFAPAAATAQVAVNGHNPPQKIGRLLIPTPGAEALARLQVRPAARQRSISRKVLGAIVGAVGGFFAGGYLGAAIEGDRCHCDDPGLKGALIGAPIGSAAGGILGWHFLF